MSRGAGVGERRPTPRSSPCPSGTASSTSGRRTKRSRRSESKAVSRDVFITASFWRQSHDRGCERKNLTRKRRCRGSTAVANTPRLTGELTDVERGSCLALPDGRERCLLLDVSDQRL